MQSFRVASRAARASAFKPSFASVSQRAFLSRTAARRDPESVNEKHINVVGYKGGQRTEEDLPVSERSNEPVAPPGQDIQAVATPLNLDILPQLTPTLRKFTLPGRVAVVTGYVTLSLSA